MSRLRTLAHRVRGMLFRHRLEHELDEEIRSHLEMQIDEFVRQGMSRDEARYAALRRFGGVDQVKEEYRDRRGLPIVETAVRDMRYSLRLLARSPGFAVTAVLTLAIGIGATTAIFTVVNRALLQALPVPDAGQVVALNNTAPNRTFPTFSYPNYADIRDRTRAFSGLIAYRYAPLSVSAGGVNERLWGFLVTGNYFEVLGVRPALGRLIGPSDDQARGAHPVAVVSYRYWQQRLGAAADIAGRTILANGRSFTIIGVAPQGFFGTDVASAPDLWFPMAMLGEIETAPSWFDDRGVEILFVVGRLRPEVSRAQAQAELTAAAIQLEQEHPRENRGKRITLSPPGLFGSMMRGPVLGFAGLLLLAAAIVLTVMCTNLANLLLARGADRQREIAVRLSLGASRFALVRQLVAESLVLAFAAGILGMIIAFWIARAVAAIKVPVDVPVALDLPLDGRALLFNVALSALTGIAFGLFPALQATKPDLLAALKSTGAAAGREAVWRRGLLVVQVALAVVLLTGSGLMLRALGQASSIPLGFMPEGAGEVTFDLRLQGYSPDQGRQLHRQVLERVRAIPGVRAAALADVIPVDLHFSRARVFADGETLEPGARAPLAFFNRVSPGYFEAMGTRLEAGRAFNGFDDGRAPRVAIVNRAFARVVLRGADPIGRRFRMNSADAPYLEIVGVVGDGKYAGFNESAQPMVYRSLLQSYSGATTVVVRGEGAMAALLGQVRRAMQELDPRMPVTARTLTEKLAFPLLPARITALMLGAFGALALLLTVIGLYGVMSYTVARRTQEIGVRMALGARRADVLRLFLTQGARLTLVGAAAGLVMALGVTRLMRSLLFGVSPTDPATYAGVILLLGTAALLACWIPARRATRMDPVEALRQE